MHASVLVSLFNWTPRLSLSLSCNQVWCLKTNVSPSFCWYRFHSVFQISSAFSGVCFLPQLLISQGLQDGHWAPLYRPQILKCRINLVLYVYERVLEKIILGFFLFAREQKHISVCWDWAVWSLKVLENVQQEIDIGWCWAKFNFKLCFNVNHETVSCSQPFIAQYLSPFFKPDVIWECPRTSWIFMLVFWAPSGFSAVGKIQFAGFDSCPVVEERNLWAVCLLVSAFFWFGFGIWYRTVA